MFASIVSLGRVSSPWGLGLVVLDVWYCCASTGHDICTTQLKCRPVQTLPQHAILRKPPGARVLSTTSSYPGPKRRLVQGHCDVAPPWSRKWISHSASMWFSLMHNLECIWSQLNWWVGTLLVPCLQGSASSDGTRESSNFRQPVSPVWQYHKSEVSTSTGKVLIKNGLDQPRKYSTSPPMLARG